ncbi:MAG: hypothetical protein E6G66_03925 [Actinobacteria bacterium]|nr:MAG: hypothetical protein E6G66_03925 [Actinomycetota bacterium]
MRQGGRPPPAAPDEPLRFVLDYAQARGAAWERRDDTTLLLLPDALQADLDLPEELIVTADPEAAREEGAVLLIHGHPIVDRAASAALNCADVGFSRLPWPASIPPPATELVLRARAALGVDHGKLDATGTPPVEAYLPVLRVGAMVSYSASLEDRFQEREEVWIDARTCLPLEAPMRAHVASQSLEAGIDPARPMLDSGLLAALATAHTLIEGRASARRAELSGQARAAREEELRRAATYYATALESIAARAATAPQERRGLLASQAEVTITERDRRLAEIEERFEPRHEIQPFRLHLVAVPALSMPVSVRRGDRAFPLTVTWVPGGVGFLPLRCPHCGDSSPLVAGRDRLGCRTCIPRPAVEPAPTAWRQEHPQGSSEDRASNVAARSPEPQRPVAPARSPARQGGQPPASKPRRATRPATATKGAVRHGAGDERLFKVGAKLATAFWDAAALGCRWRGKATAAHSPMSALARLYGTQGPFRAIGVPPGALPLDMVVRETQPHPTSPHTTSGLLATSAGSFFYTLRWQVAQGDPVVGEVLPHLCPDGALVAASSLPTIVARELLNPPPPRTPLDPVETQVWEETAGIMGLSFVLRCLAQWWQIRAAAGTESHAPGVMAAAIVERARARAGLRPRTPGQSTLWSPDPSSIQGAKAGIDRLIGAPDARPW